MLECAAYHDVSIWFALLSHWPNSINRSYRLVKQCHSEPDTDGIQNKTTADEISMLSILNPR